MIASSVIDRANAAAGTRGGLTVQGLHTQLKNSAGPSFTPPRATLSMLLLAHALHVHTALRSLWPLPLTGCSLCGDKATLFAIDCCFKAWSRDHPSQGERFHMNGVDVLGGSMLDSAVMDEVMARYRVIKNLNHDIAPTLDSNWTAAAVTAASRSGRLITGHLAAVCRHSAFTFCFPLRRGEEYGLHAAAMILAAKVRLGVMAGGCARSRELHV